AAERRELADERLGDEEVLPVHRLGDRRHVLVRELAEGVAHHLVVFAEARRDLRAREEERARGLVLRRRRLAARGLLREERRDVSSAARAAAGEYGASGAARPETESSRIIAETRNCGNTEFAPFRASAVPRFAIRRSSLSL